MSVSIGSDVRRTLHHKNVEDCRSYFNEYNALRWSIREQVLTAEKSGAKVFQNRYWNLEHLLQLLEVIDQTMVVLENFDKVYKFSTWCLRLVTDIR